MGLLLEGLRDGGPAGYLLLALFLLSMLGAAALGISSLARVRVPTSLWVLPLGCFGLVGSLGTWAATSSGISYLPSLGPTGLQSALCSLLGGALWPQTLALGAQCLYSAGVAAIAGAVVVLRRGDATDPDRFVTTRRAMELALVAVPVSAVLAAWSRGASHSLGQVSWASDSGPVAGVLGSLNFGAYALWVGLGASVLLALPRLRGWSWGGGGGRRGHRLDLLLATMAAASIALLTLPPTLRVRAELNDRYPALQGPSCMAALEACGRGLDGDVEGVWWLDIQAVDGANTFVAAYPVNPIDPTLQQAVEGCLVRVIEQQFRDPECLATQRDERPTRVGPPVPEGAYSVAPYLRP